MYTRHRAKVNVHPTNVATQHLPTDGEEDDMRQNKGAVGKRWAKKKEGIKWRQDLYRRCRDVTGCSTAEQTLINVMSSYQCPPSCPQEMWQKLPETVANISSATNPVNSQPVREKLVNLKVIVSPEVHKWKEFLPMEKYCRHRILWKYNSNKGKEKFCTFLVSPMCVEDDAACSVLKLPKLCFHSTHSLSPLSPSQTRPFFWTFRWHHLSNTKAWCLFPLQHFNVESADTTDFHWVEFCFTCETSEQFQRSEKALLWLKLFYALGRHVLPLFALKDFVKLLFADSEWKTNLLHKPIDLTFDHSGKEKLFSWLNYEQAYFFFQANVTNHTG